MALQLGATREAFIAAGTLADKASAAAEELSGYDNRLAGIETRIAVLVAMVAGLYALLAPGVWMLVRIASKTGAVGAAYAKYPCPPHRASPANSR
jgi:hypothetical protein